MIFHVSYKYACFDIQNICALLKIIITSIHVSFTHLSCNFPPGKSLDNPQRLNL
jgi:hypothetical protein